MTYFHTLMLYLWGEDSFSISEHEHLSSNYPLDRNLYLYVNKNVVNVPYTYPTNLY